MHLRRALLLFAIVLGLAALATTVSRPPQERAREPAPAPEPRRERTASPGPGPARQDAARIRFRVTGKRQERRLEAGRPATLSISSREPGQVAIPSLGLDASVARLTPARFDLLVPRPGRHRLRFTPAGSSESRSFGVLRVTPQRR